MHHDIERKKVKNWCQLFSNWIAHDLWLTKKENWNYYSDQITTTISTTDKKCWWWWKTQQMDRQTVVVLFLCDKARPIEHTFIPGVKVLLQMSSIRCWLERSKLTQHPTTNRRASRTCQYGWVHVTTITKKTPWEKTWYLLARVTYSSCFSSQKQIVLQRSEWSPQSSYDICFFSEAAIKAHNSH
jgi:hypothetical protein